MIALEADPETLRMLADSVQAVAFPDPVRARRTRDGSRGVDSAAWAQMAELGWLGVMLPEADGGSGLGLRAASVIARRLGYAAWHTPYVGAAVTITSLLAACPRSHDSTQRVASVLAGDRMVALAWEGTGRLLDATTSPISATETASATTLNGECRFVVGTGVDVFVVPAATRVGLSLHWIERDTAGLRVRAETAADGTDLLHVNFDCVPTKKLEQLATGPAAEAALADAVACRVTATAAELLGVMERALEITLDYLRTRHQFGQPIGAFQVLQHRAVDMWIQKELASAALDSALTVLESETDPVARRAAASSAKARAAQAALFVCEQAIQLHGAIGFTDECELGLHVNRALTLSADYGNATVHRRIYAAAVTPAVA